MKMSGAIRFNDILNALDIDEIPGCDLKPHQSVEFEDVIEIDFGDIESAADELGLIPDEPEGRNFNTDDIREAFSHLAKGEISIARALFDRIFDDDDASLAVEAALRAWPQFARAA